MESAGLDCKDVNSRLANVRGKLRAHLSDKPYLRREKWREKVERRQEINSTPTSLREQSQMYSRIGQARAIGVNPSDRANSGVNPHPSRVFLPKTEYARVMSAINTNYARFEGRKRAFISVGDYGYSFINNGFDDYVVTGRVKL